MSIITHPTKPLGDIAYWRGLSSDTWSYATNKGNWESAPGWPNSWNGIAEAIISSPTIINVADAINAKGITVLSMADTTLSGQPITFPDSANITSNSNLNIQNLILGAATALSIQGTGVVSGNASIADGRNLNVFAHLLINSPTNVYIPNTLSGDGIVEIIGGGHIFVDGEDAGSRAFINPIGFTGTIISPSINSIPVITSLHTNTANYLYPSWGVANTYTITSTDDDGDIPTYSASGITHGSMSVDSGTGVVTYTPTSGYDGYDDFDITVDDGYGGVVTKTVSFRPLPPYDMYVDGAGHQLAGTTNVTGVFNIRVAKNPSYKVLDRDFTGSGEIRVAYEDYASLAMDGDLSAFSGQITIMNNGSIFVGDQVDDVYHGVGTNSGSLGTATLSLNWNGGVTWSNFPGTKTVPNNTTDNGTSTGGGFYAFQQGNYLVTGTLGHRGTTSANFGATVTLSSLPTDPLHKLIVSAPWTNFEFCDAGHMILPANPNIHERHFNIGGLAPASSVGSYSNVTLYSWPGTATGTPKIFDGFAVELTGYPSGGNLIYTASCGAVIVYNPTTGIKASI